MIRNAKLPEGTRVRIQRGSVPQDPALTGRSGVVVQSSEYTAHELGVVLDGEVNVRWFAVDELERTETPALPPDREHAKRRRALP